VFGLAQSRRSVTETESDSIKGPARSQPRDVVGADREASPSSRAMRGKWEQARRDALRQLHTGAGAVRRGVRVG
jgi:hypothetical protein